MNSKQAKRLRREVRHVLATAFQSPHPDALYDSRGQGYVPQLQPGKGPRLVLGPTSFRGLCQRYKRG